MVLGSDGPNVNEAVYTAMKADVLKTRDKSLLIVGFCNIHTADNAFAKGLQKLGLDVSNFLALVHSFIYSFSECREDFENIQAKFNLPQHKLQNRVQSRWLTLEKGCVLLLNSCQQSRSIYWISLRMTKARNGYCCSSPTRLFVTI